MSDEGFTDIRRGGWIDRAPAPLRPLARLMRLDRPIGTWLLLFPCWWGTALASDGLPSARLLALFAIGAVVMRGAGCTVNDILDRDIDRLVERTRGRPIPSGAISARGAAVFLAVQLLAGLVVLLQFNRTTILFGILSLVLVFTYPLMKRVTWWPQAFLGLAFNWGALVGWTAVRGELELPAALLYAGGIAWTLGYDTIYAHQDKEDDARIGVRSTARLFGRSSRLWVGGFHVLAMILFAAAGAAAGLGPAFAIGVVVGAVFLARLTLDWDIDDQNDCLARFKAERFLGWILLAAIIAGRAAG